MEAFTVTIDRLGVVAEPNGDADEAEGVLNPAATRDRNGRLLLFPRLVGAGNTSRIGIFAEDASTQTAGFRRIGIALEPEAPYELRDVAGGYGCEDPRVTFVPPLDAYVMAYTAYGPTGARPAIALSQDGYAWERLGLMDFAATGLPIVDDKDVAFFPEPVTSPKGVASFAFYHRPMLARDNEWTRIGYVPVAAVLADRRALLQVAESVVVLDHGDAWGNIKNGAGTPPVRIAEGWLSLFHGVDGVFDDGGALLHKRYSAGLVIHDSERPHIVRYRSPSPILIPETTAERSGIMHDVVFPTGIDPRTSDDRDLDVYYGMADERIGRLRLRLEAESFEHVA